MDTRRLKCFLMLAEELHFGRAAARLNMTQPPLSMAIKQFEDELGVPLLIRTTRTVQLTPAGETLQLHGHALMEQMARIRRLVSQVATGLVGHISIGYVGAAAEMGLPEVIRAFRLHAAGIGLDVQEFPNQAITKGLLNGTVDIGFVRGEPKDPLEYRPFATERYCLAIPADHEFAELENVPLEAFDGMPLIFFPRRYQAPLYDAWWQTFRSLGVHPNVVQNVLSMSAEIALVQAGVGIALVSQSVTQTPRQGIVYRPIVGDTPKVELHVAWHPDRASEAVQRFLAHLPG